MVLEGEGTSGFRWYKIDKRKTDKTIHRDLKIYESYFEKERQEKAKTVQLRKTGSRRGWNLRKKMIDGHYGRFLGTNSKKKKRK